MCLRPLSAPPGDDATGQALKQQAAPVLAALSQYQQGRGQYPSSLYLLVPKYLKAIPFDPDLQLDAGQGTLSLYYKEAWPKTGAISCATPIKETGWICRDAR